MADGDELDWRGEYKALLGRILDTTDLDDQLARSCAEALATIFKEHGRGVEFYRDAEADLVEVLYESLPTQDADHALGKIDSFLGNIEVIRRRAADHVDRADAPHLDRLFNVMRMDVEEERHRIQFLARMHDDVVASLDAIEELALFSQETQDELKELSPRVAELRKEMNGLSPRVVKLRRKIDNAERDYIAILGIFAAVVMAFVGGTGFLDRSFAALADADPLDLICLALAVGLVILALFFVTFAFVWRLCGHEFDSKSPFVGAVPMTALIVMGALLAIACICRFLLG